MPRSAILLIEISHLPVELRSCLVNETLPLLHDIQTRQILQPTRAKLEWSTSPLSLFASWLGTRCPYPSTMKSRPMLDPRYSEPTKFQTPLPSPTPYSLETSHNR